MKIVTPFSFLTCYFAYICRPKLLTIKSSEKIADIHNYCDRWCDRCSMTEHCTIFVPSGKKASLKADQIYSAGNFEKAQADFKSWIRTNHILYEELIPGSEADKRRREKNLSHARTNETSKLAGDYRVMSMSFRSTNKAIFSDPENAGSEVQNALETISWYETQLPVKINRAYLSFAAASADEENMVQTDFNGSAKIALLGIESSFQALHTLIAHFPKLESTCRASMLLLDRVRNRLLTDFPLAKDFMRPGFDELVHN